MKKKTPITKSIAAILCIVTLTLSWNLYLSYQDLYFTEWDVTNSIVHIATAKPSIANSFMSSSDNELPSLSVDSNVPSKTTQQRKILLHVFVLFLSFVSLSILQNAVFKLESNGNDKSWHINSHQNKSNHITKLPSAYREGVK